MQKHRAIFLMHNSNLGRYCTFLYIQHQFYPCDISAAAICKDIGRFCTVLNTQHQVYLSDISDAAICKDLGYIASF